MKPASILHLSSSIGQTSFGLGQVVVNLAKAQNDLNADARIWCLDSEDQIEWAVTSSGLGCSRVMAFPSFGPTRFGFSPAMLSAAKSNRHALGVVHQHGIWTAGSQVSNVLRRTHTIPVVVAPHGSLDPWALKRSMNKKRLALFLYERENLKQAACLHALSEREAKGFRDFGLCNPIAVIPNGISPDWISSSADGQAFRHKYQISAHTKVMLFLGRITPKKGLPMLLKAMRGLEKNLANWQFLIAGVDEFNHQREIEQMVQELLLAPYVQFIGPQFDQEKREAYAAADLFILPSHSEGAPMTVLEALGANTPVFTTKASPCEYLLTNKCGWWTDVTVSAIRDSLADALNTPKEALAEMGCRGKALVSAQFTWSKIAEQTIVLYDWLLGRSQQPNFLIED
ncbi:MAG: glycosyltransferase [Chloroflexi bacterium]|nr:glycosyltransferase [Chloroflexota bacterium]